MKRTYIVLLIALFFLVTVSGQEQVHPINPPIPTITFDLLWEAATPQNYTVKVDGTGAAKYTSRNPTRPESAGEPPYIVDFTMSPPNQARIFEAAKSLNYFHGDFDYKQHKIANTGRKTLTYADSTRHFETTYNWSENKEIQELTAIFQGISNTVEHGNKLQFLRRFDKLGLDKELNAMEALAHDHNLAELQIIAPTLETIANDPAVMNIARQRARHLLEGLQPAQD